MLYYKNELSHHGVKGMKWGVRKERRSIGGNARRALAGVYGINEKTYRRLGNNTLASMNAAERNRQLEKASVADKVAQQKRAAKQQAKLGKKIAKENKFKVDTSKAKNSATKRVAEDTHRLSNQEFKAKYHTSKKTFAKRYEKTGGDTFTLGRKKQALAVAYLSRSKGNSWAKTASSVAKYDTAAKAEQKLLDKGHNTASTILRNATDYDIKRKYK